MVFIRLKASNFCENRWFYRVSNLKIGKNVILDRLTYASSTVRTSSPWFISAILFWPQLYTMRFIYMGCRDSTCGRVGWGRSQQWQRWRCCLAQKQAKGKREHRWWRVVVIRGCHNCCCCWMLTLLLWRHPVHQAPPPNIHYTKPPSHSPTSDHVLHGYHCRCCCLCSVDKMPTTLTKNAYNMAHRAKDPIPVAWVVVPFAPFTPLFKPFV